MFGCAQNEIEFDNMDLNFFVWGLKYSYQDKWEYLMTKFKNKIIKRGTMKMLSEMCGQKEELKDMEERVEVTHELGSYQRRMIDQGIHQGECKIIKMLFGRAIGGRCLWECCLGGYDVRRRYSAGDIPYCLAKARRNVDIELKPDCSAISSCVRLHRLSESSFFAWVSLRELI